MDDIPKLMSLVNKAYRGEEAKKGWTHEADLIDGSLRTDEISLKKMIEDPNAVILKYQDKDRILGCVYLEKKAHKLYLGLLSVLPDIQGGGIGKKLLTAAEEHAGKNDCILIEMTVISVRKKLIDWYERHGYRKTKKTEPFHNNKKFGVPREPIEFVVMEKEISS